MKIDRQHRTDQNAFVKQCFTTRLSQFQTTFGISIAILMLTPISLCSSTAGYAQAQVPSKQALAPSKQLASKNPGPDDEATHQQATDLIEQVINRLANGRAFDCKIRQRVRTAGREVVGVGTYLQVGGGTGQFSFQIKMHDGDGKHTLQQISDGRLAWTRSEIAGTVELSRVDVGWLDEGARTLRRDSRIKPSMRVGGPSEMLDTIRRDYDLKLGTSSLEGRPLLVIIGTLNSVRRKAITDTLGGSPLPILYPTRVNIAIARADDPESGFGKGLPMRIEHLSDPVALSKDPKKELESQIKTRQMISLLEFYSIRPVAPPPIQRFRFENEDTEIDFVNETSRYEDRFNIRVSAKERAKYR